MPITASAVRHSYDGDPIVAHGVENQMVADWKKAHAAGEVVAFLARVRMAGEHLAGFGDPVELPIPGEWIGGRDVSPGFHEGEFSEVTARCKAQCARVPGRVRQRSLPRGQPAP